MPEDRSLLCSKPTRRSESEQRFSPSHMDCRPPRTWRRACPPLRALRDIERLDQGFGPESSRALPTDPGMSARLSESLRELAGWATGVRLAYETLSDSDGNA